MVSFLLGIISQKTDIIAKSLNKFGLNGKLPNIRERVYTLLSYYLLIRIGLSGGTELKLNSNSNILATGATAVGLSILMFFLTFFLLQLVSFDKNTKVSVAAHFGSVSIGTFTATLALLSGMQVSYSPEAGAWVAMMELPAPLLAALWLGWYRLKNKDHTIPLELKSRKLIPLLGNLVEMLILPLALITGVLIGPEIISFGPANFLFNNAFWVILVYFLFEMGRRAYKSLATLGKDTNRLHLLVFGLGLPLLGGTLGTALTRLLGMSLGDAVILGTLCASGSYVAAPSLIKWYFDMIKESEEGEKVVGLSLAIVLGVTLPFNILIGIYLYLFEARLFENSTIAAGVLIVLALCAIVTIAIKPKFQSTSAGRLTSTTILVKLGLCNNPTALTKVLDKPQKL
jgi:hypothetical protein